MKKLFALFAILITLNATAQERGDNTAIIITDLEYAEAFRTMGQLMTTNGFTIDNADRDFGRITTREVRVGRRLDPLWEMKVTAIVSDGQITLTAQVRPENDSWRNLHLAGRMTMMYKAWEQFQELAEMFPSAEISFENR